MAGDFGSGSLMRFQSRYQLGLPSYEVLAWLGYPFPTSFTWLSAGSPSYLISGPLHEIIDLINGQLHNMDDFYSRAMEKTLRIGAKDCHSLICMLSLFILFIFLAIFLLFFLVKILNFKETHLLLFMLFKSSLWSILPFAILFMPKYKSNTWMWFVHDLDLGKAYNWTNSWAWNRFLYQLAPFSSNCL